jgi:hypothetical protein
LTPAPREAARRREDLAAVRREEEGREGTKPKRIKEEEEVTVEASDPVSRTVAEYQEEDLEEMQYQGQEFVEPANPELWR